MGLGTNHGGIYPTRHRRRAAERGLPNFTAKNIGGSNRMMRARAKSPGQERPRAHAVEISRRASAAGRTNLRLMGGGGCPPAAGARPPRSGSPARRMAAPQLVRLCTRPRAGKKSSFPCVAGHPKAPRVAKRALRSGSDEKSSQLARNTPHAGRLSLVGQGVRASGIRYRQTQRNRLPHSQTEPNSAPQLRRAAATRSGYRPVATRRAWE